MKNELCIFLCSEYDWMILNFKMIFIIGSVKFSELKLLLVYSEILKSLQYSRKKSSKTEQHHCLPK